MVDQVWFDRYRALHIQAVEALLVIGIRVDIKERLQLFKLFNQIPRRAQGRAADVALALIEALVQLRIMGAEPEFKGKRYI